MTACLFLDRDGVINVDVGYAYRPTDIRFVPGIFQLCRFFQRQGYLIIVVTNQSGIARQYYSETDFLQLSAWMKRLFRIRGIKIQETLFCPHHPSITGACDCRKPRPGMLTHAINQYRIDPNKSIMIGDKLSDMEAANHAGISTRVWLSSPRPLALKNSLATQAVNSHFELLHLYRSNKLQA